MTELAKKDREIAELKDTVRSLTDENDALRRKLERMNELLLNAQRARFGQSSEKKVYVMEDGEQLRMFNEAETVPKAEEGAAGKRRDSRRRDSDTGAEGRRQACDLRITNVGICLNAAERKTCSVL